MKRTGRIFLYPGGAILVFIALLFLFRGPVISFLIKKIISEKSDGKVELTLDSFHINLPDNYMLAENPTFLFSDLYMDESRSVKVEKINYEKIKIEELDIWALLFEQDIIARSFLVDKPQFWLSEHKSEAKSDFSPEKLIKTLNQNPDIFSHIRIKIENIEIHYGSIKMSGRTSPDADPAIVDFTILLKNFDTHPDTAANPDRLLYSDEFMLKLANLHQELNSGYLLHIDSASFSSKHRNLILNRASLQPGEKIVDQNNIGVEARKMAFNDIGLDEIRGLEDLNLRSVMLSDGKLTHYINKKDGNVREADNKANSMDQLIRILYDFRLDSVSFNNFDYYNIENHADTLTSVNGIDFLMTDIVIDSSMFRNFFWNIHYKDLLIKTGALTTNRFLPDYRIAYEGLRYISGEQKLHIEQILLSSETLENKEENTRLNIPLFTMKGFSVNALQKRKKQHLSITIAKPEGTLNLSQSTNRMAGDGHTLFPGYIYLDKIELLNGNLHLIKDSTLKADVANLCLTVNSLHLPETNKDNLRFKNITIHYDHGGALLGNNALSISTGKTNYEKGNLSLELLRVEQNSTDSSNFMTARAIHISDFDRKRMMETQEIHLGRLLISSPYVSSRHVSGSKNRQKNKKPWEERTSPLSVTIDELVVEHGKIQSAFEIDKYPVKIYADYHLNLDGIEVMKGDTLVNRARNLGWSFQLENLEAEAARHRLKLKKLLSDSHLSSLRIEQLNLSEASGAPIGPKSVIARSVNLPLIDLSGINYKLLVHYDSLNFRTLRVEQPFVDILLLTKNNKTQPDYSSELFKPEDYLVLNYDSLIINSLYMNIEKRGVASTEFISLKDFNFSHLKNDRNQENLMNDLILNFEEFNFHGDTTQLFLIINKGQLDNKNNFFYLENIRGHMLSNGSNGEDEHKASGVRFAARNIGLSGIMIKETLPTQISASKLEIKHLDLDIIQKHFDSKITTKFSPRPDPIKKFSKLFTSLQLETAHMDDMTLNLHVANDTISDGIRFDSIDIVLHKIQIDTSLIYDKNPAVIQQLSVDMKGRTKISADSLYALQTAKLHYNFPDRRITIDSLYITPLFGPEEFFRRAQYQTDRAHFFSKQIEINDVNLVKLLSDKHVHVSSVTLRQVVAEIYRNKQYPLKPGLYKPLPKELLMNIRRSFTIDSALIVNGYLMYKELDAKAEEPGEIFFNNFNIAAYNITNYVQEGEKKDLIVNLNARIMGEAGIYLNLQFPLYPDSISFRMTGKTEKIDLTTLNPLTTNLLGLGIIKGVGRADITYISGNDSIAKGSLIFRYRKLRLLPYNRKKEKLRKGALSPLYSFMINDLAVKSNNPKFARKPRVGQVYFERDTRKSVINYVWKSVLTGLMSTLGFSSKEQKKQRKEVKKEEKEE